MTMKSSELQSLMKRNGREIDITEQCLEGQKCFLRSLTRNGAKYTSEGAKQDAIKICVKSINWYKKDLKRLRQLQVSLKKELKRVYFIENMLAGWE